MRRRYPTTCRRAKRISSSTASPTRISRRSRSCSTITDSRSSCSSRDGGRTLLVGAVTDDERRAWEDVSSADGAVRGRSRGAQRASSRSRCANPRFAAAAAACSCIDGTATLRSGGRVTERTNAAAAGRRVHRDARGDADAGRPCWMQRRRSAPAADQRRRAGVGVRAAPSRPRRAALSTTNIPRGGVVVRDIAGLALGDRPADQGGHRSSGAPTLLARR